MSIHEEFLRGAIPVVGTVRGARVFRAQEDGHLTGVTFRQPWVAGENVAVCVFAEADDEEGARFPEGWASPGDYRTPPAVGQSRTDPHVPGSLGCSCGFWSYHQGDGMAWATCTGVDRAVPGVVHVYGRMTRGSLGFRSEKARLVALVVPRWADVPPPRIAAGITDEAVEKVWAAWRRRHVEGAARWAAVVARYPTLPLYPDPLTALAAHPLSAA